MVNTIRSARGKNDKRIIILGAPEKTSVNLDNIDKTIYENDPYMLVEWHFYAGGPNKNILRNNRTVLRYWSGNGTEGRQRQVLPMFIEIVENFIKSGGLLGYFGAWMPKDNIRANLVQEEVVNFARFFVNELKVKQIPWSLNVLDDYYNTVTSEWRNGTQLLPRFGQHMASLEMDIVLQNILDVLSN